MSQTSIDEELRSELAAVAESQGCELLEASFHRGTLRIFLDRADGGVTIDDCQHVSKQISPLLDVHEFGSGRYTLEVSSPGLDRKLYGPADYRRFVESLVRVTFLDGPDRAKKTIVGRLQSFDEDSDTLQIHEENGDRNHQVPVGDIQLARLEIEL